MSDVRPTAFVLMPFGESFNQVWELLIRPALEEAGFDPRRADSLDDQQNILRVIVRGIVDASLIVADVTGLNENVLYELGIAHALGKRCVMITQRLDELPFDLRPYRANEYSTNFAEAEKLKELLTRVGTTAIAGGAEFRTPVVDFAPEVIMASADVPPPPGQGASPAAASRDVTGTDRDHPPDGELNVENDDDDVPLGLLEIQEELAVASDELLEATNEISDLTSGLTDKIIGHTKDVEDIQKRYGDQAAGPMLHNARAVAQSYEEYANAIVGPRERMAAGLRKYVELSDLMVRTSPISSHEEADAAEATAVAMDEFSQTLAESYQSSIEFVQSLHDAPHVSRDLTRANRRTAKEISTTATVVQTAHAEVARVANLLRQRVEEYRRPK